jgi:[acyl-carrier-protein] S-malonyltransferase
MLEYWNVESTPKSLKVDFQQLFAPSLKPACRQAGVKLLKIRLPCLPALLRHIPIPLGEGDAGWFSNFQIITFSNCQIAELSHCRIVNCRIADLLIENSRYTVVFLLYFLFLCPGLNRSSMKAYVFPGQGAQFVGMGKDLHDGSALARQMFEKANEILGFRVTDLMFAGSDDDLKQTRVTQPVIFLHSVIIAKVMGQQFDPGMVAGHSLGELSALVAVGALSFEDGLKMVAKRAHAMQLACEKEPSTMAAILGLDDAIVEKACNEIAGIVVPANYNSPGQIVISGSIKGIETAVEKLTALGAKRALILKVGGAFHSPLMEPARAELEKAIDSTHFSKPICPVYQNVTALPSVDPEQIKLNLKKQLTAPVKWTQTVQNMLKDGATAFYEVGPGSVLQGLIKKVDRNVVAESAKI